MKKKLKNQMFPMILTIIVIITIIWVGVEVVQDVLEVPFDLCKNKTGLIESPEQDYILYNCDKVNNITMTLS